jgi:hypothetical protein
MGPRNRTPWNLIHDQQSSLLNKQTWHHVLEKSKPQINNINRLQAPFQRLLFKSGVTKAAMAHSGRRVSESEQNSRGHYDRCALEATHFVANQEPL